MIQALRMLRATLILYRTDLAKFDAQTDWERNTFAAAEDNPTSRGSLGAIVLIKQGNETLAALRAGITHLGDLLKGH